MNKRKRKDRFIFFSILLIIVLIVGSILIISKINSGRALINQNSDGYVHLSKSDILVSFKIDDITFAKEQKPVLENALVLARKYNITFDLGVIAKPFSENKDSETFKIYQDNQDVFEIVAHGYTHALDSMFADEYGAYGEFYVVSYFSSNKSVPINIQEKHIQKMKEIFEKNNLTLATKIFIVPYHSGDDNTIKLAEKYGYRLIVQQLSIPKNYSEKNYKNIIASENFIDIHQDNLFDETDWVKYNIYLNRAINVDQTRIEISMHPINFQILENADNFFKGLVRQDNPWIKFGMITNRFQ